MESELTTGIVKYDVVVVGAGYGGLITGAILSRNGLKTVVVDELDQVGGRGGSTFYHGYWLDYGHRDARDHGDDYMIIGATNHYGMKAAEAAGADLTLVGPMEPMLYIHWERDPGKGVPLTLTPEGFLQAATEGLGLPPDKVPDFMSMMAGLIVEDAQKLITKSFKEWLPTLDEAVRKAILRLAHIMAALPPEETSLGRFIQFLQDPVQIYRTNDPEVGGMQGFIEPYARAIRKHGGEIKLGLQTYEILVEKNRVAGIVVRDRTNATQEFHAPVVVFALPIWEVFKVLDKRHFPREVVENARKLKKYDCDTMYLDIGVSRLPTIRATGQPDTYAGWHMLPNIGWHIPTNSSRKSAPPGKHLVSIAGGTSGTGVAGRKPFKSFAEAKRWADSTHDFVRKYYADLDEITEWKAYRLIKAPTWIGFFWKPVPRAPFQIPKVQGLYFVGSTVEAAGCYQDIDAHSALQVSQMVLEATTAAA